jgi:hypothetical protein
MANGRALRSGAGLRTGAWVAFGLLVAIAFASAFIRLAHGDATLAGAIEVARGAHRGAAGVAFAVILVMATLGWDDLQPLRGGRAAIAAQVALAVALALLGYYAPSDHPLARFGNPVGGLAMIGIAWWLALAASGGGAAPLAAPRLGTTLIVAAFAGIIAIVIWPPPLAAGLAAQLAATVALAAGVVLATRGDEPWRR